MNHLIMKLIHKWMITLAAITYNVKVDVASLFWKKVDRSDNKKLFEHLNS